MLGLAVTPSYFSVLGVTPVIGRTLAADSAGPAEVVIGYGYWQRRFGGSATALGRTLILDGHPYTIVGVTPPGLPGQGEFWTRLSFTAADPMTLARWAHFLVVLGRLKPGVTREGAQKEMETIAARLTATYPKTNKGWSVMTVPLLDQVVGPVRPALIMLLAAAACVLLIGAANLANLFLVRCLAREREMALRTALGATRSRLVRELLAEAATLGAVAGALGVGVAFVGVRVLRALAPSTLPRLSEIGVDARVVSFCAVTSIATVFVFGVIPAWQVSRGNLASVLKEGGRGTGSAQHHRLQDGLVVLQVAVALILLTGAGLLVESFDHFRTMDPGFRSDGVLTAQIALQDDRYPTPERQAAFVANAVDRLAALPGVSAASASSNVPGFGGGSAKRGLTIVGDPAPDPTHIPVAQYVTVTPDYFHTMGIALRQGRVVLPSDDGRARKVVVIDEMLAEQLFAGRDPIGRLISLNDLPDTLQIVGVVASVRQGGLLTSENLPEIYVPMAQFPQRGGLDVADPQYRAARDPAG